MITVGPIEMHQPWVLEHVLSRVQQATHLYMLSKVAFYNVCCKSIIVP